MSESLPRLVVCAAMQCANGLVILSVRHWDAYAHEMYVMCPSGKGRYDSVTQGFVDQHGVFMDRQEAWRVAEAAGQIRRRVGGDASEGGTLYSENLY